MPRDAKFGLVLGLCLVIMIAVLVFRRDRDPGSTATVPSAVSLNQSTGHSTAPPVPFIPKQTQTVHAVSP